MDQRKSKFLREFGLIPKENLDNHNSKTLPMILKHHKSRKNLYHVSFIYIDRLINSSLFYCAKPKCHFLCSNFEWFVNRTDKKDFEFDDNNKTTRQKSKLQILAKQKKLAKQYTKPVCLKLVRIENLDLSSYKVNFNFFL